MKHLDTFKLFNEKMALDNYDEYAKLVADDSVGKSLPD